MSTHSAPARRITIPAIRARKGGEPLAVIAAYTAWEARLFDPHLDMFIVGDSLGMVLYGMQSTLPVTLELMIAHGRAVVEASSQACVVVDMPFGSYQGSPEAAFNASARVMQETGCTAVKLEGGEEMADTIAFMSARGIPVMGHVALQPQRVHMMGGYRYQGRTPEERKQIMKDALAIEKAGAFAVVLEGVEESLAREITGRLAIPTIGIGASPACDGQVLVAADMLGITQTPAKFVKRFAQLGEIISGAAAQYTKEVRARKFPGLEHCYTQGGSTPPKVKGKKDVA